MTLQKAIFDMDGTILDSTAMWRSAAAHVGNDPGAFPQGKHWTGHPGPG